MPEVIKQINLGPDAYFEQADIDLLTVLLHQSAKRATTVVYNKDQRHEQQGRRLKFERYKPLGGRFQKRGNKNKAEFEFGLLYADDKLRSDLGIEDISTLRLRLTHTLALARTNADGSQVYCVYDHENPLGEGADGKVFDVLWTIAVPPPDSEESVLVNKAEGLVFKVARTDVTDNLYESKEQDKAARKKKIERAVNEVFNTNLINELSNEEAHQAIINRSEAELEMTNLAVMKHPEYVSHDSHDIKVRSLQKKINGITLERWLQQNTLESVSMRERLQLMRSLYRAAKRCHGLGLVHRDLKPDNLIINGDSIEIVDLGVSKWKGSRNTVMHLPHQPLEASQRGEAVQESIDIFSLGIMCYQIAYMDLEVAPESMRVAAIERDGEFALLGRHFIQNHQHNIFDSNDEIDRKIAAFLQKNVELERHNRTASDDDAIAMLDEILAYYDDEPESILGTVADTLFEEQAVEPTESMEPGQAAEHARMSEVSMSRDATGDNGSSGRGEGDDDDLASLVDETGSQDHDTDDPLAEVRNTAGFINFDPDKTEFTDKDKALLTALLKPGSHVHGAKTEGIETYKNDTIVDHLGKRPKYERWKPVAREKDRREGAVSKERLTFGFSALDEQAKSALSKIEGLPSIADLRISLSHSMVLTRVNDDGSVIYHVYDHVNPVGNGNMGKVFNVLWEIKVPAHVDELIAIDKPEKPQVLKVVTDAESDDGLVRGCNEVYYADEYHDLQDEQRHQAIVTAPNQEKLENNKKSELKAKDGEDASKYVKKYIHTNAGQRKVRSIQTKQNGEQLLKWINSDDCKQASILEQLGVIDNMLEALLPCENKKFSHRDIKPENLLKALNKINLVDFGLSQMFDEFSKCGTPLYLAPENHSINCKVQITTDIFSVGIISYMLLFRGKKVNNKHRLAYPAVMGDFLLQNCYQVNEGPLKGLDLISEAELKQTAFIGDNDIDDLIVAFLQKLTAKKPKHRYQSIIDARDDLKNIKDKIEALTSQYDSVKSDLATQASQFTGSDTPALRTLGRDISAMTAAADVLVTNTPGKKANVTAQLIKMRDYIHNSDEPHLRDLAFEGAKMFPSNNAFGKKCLAVCYGIAALGFLGYAIATGGTGLIVLAGLAVAHAVFTNYLTLKKPSLFFTAAEASKRTKTALEDLGCKFPEDLGCEFPSQAPANVG